MSAPPATHFSAAAFSEAPPPPRPSVGYRISLVAVAFAMVLLPLIYVALVACTAWGWGWYLRNGLAVVAGIDSHRARGTAYVGPLVVGAVLVFFMLKPLLARPPKGHRSRTLDSRREPALHAFIRDLCAAQGAPVPTRIDVDLRVNASASFGRGLRMLFKNDLVLTLGLPLVACLEARHLAAVLAHEFGHFSQAIGMRAYFLIATVENWFARVVHERDAWDERLERWAEGGGMFTWQPALMVQVALVFVWMTRRVLEGLMLLGRLLSSLLSRQMEFDADAHAVRIVGPETFAQSMQRIVMADFAFDLAQGVALEYWSKNRLPDDLPGIARIKLGEIETETQQRIFESSLEQSAGMYASHPPLRERIRRGRELEYPGVVEIAGPAAQLFSDFGALCRARTRASFHDRIEGLDQSVFVGIEEVEIEATRREAAVRARRAIFGSTFGAPILLEVPWGTGLPRQTATRETWRAARGEAVALSDVGRSRLADADDRLAAAQAARSLLKQGLEIRPKDFRMPDRRATAHANAAGRELDGLRAALTPHAKIHLERVRQALGLAASVSADEHQVAGARALRALADLTIVSGRIESVRRANRVLDVIAATRGVDDPVGRFAAWEIRARALLDLLRTLVGELEPFHSPFEHARSRVTLAEIALPEIPEDWRQAGAETGLALSRLYELYERCLGNLAEAVIAIEAKLEGPPNTPGTDASRTTP